MAKALEIAALALWLNRLASAAACTDQDKQIWSQKGSAAFTSDMDACGHQCALSDKSCASKCVQGKEGYSDSCASCFGDLFACTRDHCKLACIGGQTEACTDCVKKAGCPGPFTGCSGFTPPSSNVVASTCTGSADPQVGVCYQGSSSVLGEKETIHVKVDSYASGKGVMDLTGSRVQAISCVNKPFTKTGQNISTDVSDCIHVFGLKLSEVAYCSDQDKVDITLKVAGFNDRAELQKVSCAALAPPPSDAACTDQDKQIWSQKGSAAFTSDMDACGHQCALSDKSCASKCVQGKEGYSDSCASCFGDLFACTRDHCKLACIGGQTEACTDCVKKAGCPGPFTGCSGFTPPSSNVVASTCTGSADPQVGVCYQGSSSVLGEKETIHVKVDSYASGKGVMDLTGSGVQAISCVNKPFTKTGQNISTDVSDCIHVFGLKLSEVAYCSDQDKVDITLKVAGFNDRAELQKVSCAALAPPPSDAACTDQDKQIWSQKGSAAFTSDMDACGHQCALSDKSCASKCVQGKEGYSDSCASCFGDLFACTRDHCKLACIGGQTEACTDCVKKAGCPGPFTGCSGFTPPSSNVVASTCTGSADPQVGVCYQGSSSVLGEKETIHVKVDSYAGGKGVMDLTGSGVQAISCVNKPFTKTGQNISTDVSDCIHVFGLKLSEVAYCSDQDKVDITLKVAGFNDRAELQKVSCAETAIIV